MSTASSNVFDFRFTVGRGLGYRVTILPDRDRGGWSAKLVADGIGTLMEPNGKSPSDALTRLARELWAGDTRDRTMARKIAKLAWFPLKMS